MTEIEDQCHTQVSHQLAPPLGRVRRKCLDAARLHHQRAREGGGQCRCCSSFQDLQLEHVTRGHYACVRAVACGMKLADPLLRNPEVSPLRDPGRLIFSPPPLSRDAVRPWTCVWPPPLQQQLAETPHRRHLVPNSRITEMKLWNCGNRAFTLAFLFGQRTDDRTQP